MINLTTNARDDWVFHKSVLAAPLVQTRWVGPRLLSDTSRSMFIIAQAPSGHAMIPCISSSRKSKCFNRNRSASLSPPILASAHVDVERRAVYRGEGGAFVLFLEMRWGHVMMRLSQ
jgi:hypothetical protein